MRKSLLFTALLITVHWADPAAAQEAARVGVAMGYPSIGILWRASDRVAVRPEVTFQGEWSDSDEFSSSGTATSFGASVLFYLRERDGLRPYVSPRFSFTRSSTDLDNSQSGGGSSQTTDSYSFAGSLGAEYALGRRFSVFGELGFVYTRKSSSGRFISATSSTTAAGTADSFATRSGVGVVVWF